MSAAWACLCLPRPLPPMAQFRGMSLRCLGPQGQRARCAPAPPACVTAPAASGCGTPAPPAHQYSRLQLRPEPQLPPRVEHILVEGPGRAADVVAASLGLPPQYAEDLFTFGAVYFSALPPHPPPNLPEDVAALYRRFIDSFEAQRREAKAARRADSSEPAPYQAPLHEQQSVRRVASPDAPLAAGSYVRVHVHPKRFPRCYALDWAQLVVAQTDDFVVVDKPAGVLVGGTVDNLVESCAACVGRALGMPGPLQLTHQLDACTQGCVVLAKNREFASSFNGLLKDRLVQKVYRVLSRGAPPQLGLHTHYMMPSRYPPRILSQRELPSWQRCQLEVLSVAQHPVPPRSVLEGADVDRSTWPDEGAPLYESMVKLITGRTHQLRAQFAFSGSPIVGDTMYGKEGAEDFISWLAQHTGTGEPARAQGNNFQGALQEEEAVLRGAQSTGAQRPAAFAVGSGAGGDAGRVEGGAVPAQGGAEEEEGVLGNKELFLRARDAFGPGPDGSIGLQAYQIQWEGHVYNARDPWWRTGES